FHHVVAKFGRSTRPQPVSRFLSGHIVNYLRYCPLCIAEYGYYFLTWRFAMLSACPEHHSRLLSVCTYCGHRVPLLPTPLKIGICPHCSADLRTCSTEFLTEAEQQTNLRTAKEVEFLISPQSWEGTGKTIIQFVGRIFAERREQANIGSTSMAQILGVTSQ